MNYQELKDLVLKYNKAYFDEHHSLVGDEEYSILYDKLQTVEEAQGWVDSDSPTSRVGHQSG